jgi:hypothetical protein
VVESAHPPLDAKKIGGIKRLRHLLPLLADLRDVGCDRDAAGNRQLHFDEYVTLVLLYLMNPLIDSVRGLQKASVIDKVSEQLGVKRFSLGSFSESVRVFDPEKLKAVITQLAGELKPVNADPRLKTHLHHALTIADGTVLDAIARVSAAVWLPFKDGTVKHAWKLHVQFDFEAEKVTSINSSILRRFRRSSTRIQRVFQAHALGHFHRPCVTAQRPATLQARLDPQPLALTQWLVHQRRDGIRGHS